MEDYLIQTIKDLSRFYACMGLNGVKLEFQAREPFILSVAEKLGLDVNESGIDAVVYGSINLVINKR